MKKSIFAMLAACLALSGCRGSYTVSQTVNPNTEVVSKVSADLDVSPVRISYTYRPTSETYETSFDNVLQTAISQALEKNGGGDLLVDLRYTYTCTRYFWSRRLESITVSGYPATYVGFRSLRLKGYSADGAAIYEEVPSEQLAAEKAAAEKAAEKTSAATTTSTSATATSTSATATSAAETKVAAIDHTLIEAGATGVVKFLQKKNETPLATTYQSVIDYVNANPTEDNYRLLQQANIAIQTKQSYLYDVKKAIKGVTDPAELLNILAAL